jgi:hypothetical protein
MKKFTYQALRMLAFGLMSATLVLSSCKKDDDEDPAPETFADPTITATANQSQQKPGEKVTFTIAVAAEGGLASVKQGTTEIKTYTDSKTTDVFTYEFTIPEGQAEGALQVPFTVTDKQSTAKTASASPSITVTETPTPTVVIEDPISEDMTLTADTYWVLKGNIYVESGAELTIEPGTVIIGDKITKGALIVSRGAMIHAQGTAEAPIIFTSSAPPGFRNYGDWGGVVLLGNAKNNQNIKQKIEGISATEGDNGFYGGDGSLDDESTGEFYYVRIEFAGIALSTDNELNGLTMGGVGSGTEIHHVQVSYSGDDSFEWFGGTVGTDHIVAYRGWDDDFDTDFGHSGVHQFLVAFRDANIADKSGSNGFESDNDAAGDGNTPITHPLFANMSWFGPYTYANLTGAGALNKSNINQNYQRGAHIRRNSSLEVYNSAFVGYYLDGILFDKPNAGAVVRNNYFGRSLNATTYSKSDGTTYDATYFEGANTIETPLSTVDLHTKFADLTAVGNLAAPNPLLATDSPLLTAGTDELPEGLEATAYIGAFDATNNWLTGWTNFDPNNANYGN